MILLLSPYHFTHLLAQGHPHRTEPILCALGSNSMLHRSLDNSGLLFALKCFICFFGCMSLVAPVRIYHVNLWKSGKLLVIYVLPRAFMLLGTRLIECGGV